VPQPQTSSPPLAAGRAAPPRLPSARLRRLQAEAGFVCSAGVASNKQLSKMAAGLHKPNGQTILPPPEAAAFVAPLPVRALPGVGEGCGV
jgi:nucleotidyltransferase/DNA polymerase involved in DNA repair